MEQQFVVVIAAILGIAMGFLYGVSGFGDAGKSEDLSKNPRVKNLIWLVGGAATVFLADWRIMSGGAIEPAFRGKLVLAYVVAALLTSILTIAVTSAGIFLTVRAAARTNPGLANQNLVMDYITSGYSAYRSRRSEIEAAAENRVTTADALGELGKALSVLFSATALDREEPNNKRREEFIDNALEAMEDTVKLFAAGIAGLTLQTNYMVKVPHGKLGGAALRFAPDPVESYSGFLVLRRYRGGRKMSLALPIGDEQKSLPGAPMAVAKHAACALNTSKLTFASGIPANTRRDVKAFFRRADYLSVLSVPLIWQREVVGVVNVESNQIDVVGKGPNIIPKVGLALAPYCVIMGELVSRTE